MAKNSQKIDTEKLRNQGEFDNRVKRFNNSAESSLGRAKSFRRFRSPIRFGSFASLLGGIAFLYLGVYAIPFYLLRWNRGCVFFFGFVGIFVFFVMENAVRTIYSLALPIGIYTCFCVIQAPGFYTFQLHNSTPQNIF